MKGDSAPTTSVPLAFGGDPGHHPAMSSAPSEPGESAGSTDPLAARVRALAARVTELEMAATFDRQAQASLDEVVREFAERVQQLEQQIRDLSAQESAGAEVVRAPIG